MENVLQMRRVEGDVFYGFHQRLAYVSIYLQFAASRQKKGKKS